MEATSLSPAIKTLLSRIDEIRDYWRTHWIKKIKKEIPARLSLWGSFLREAKEDGITLSEYCYQVRLRVMLELLVGGLPDPPDVYKQQLLALDQLLGLITSPWSFVWEAEVMPAFPEAGYWFLYRTPEKGKAK
ncbi:MAG: hypothetical protein IT308_07660 [Anaerolineaceae bacterium]|nr:hypothetical protein [Anaerolineaceae bacterium]